MKNIGADEVARVLRYEPESGKFHWLVSPSQAVKAGDEAGSVNSKGYTVIGVAGRVYAAHRLAWLLTYGALPKKLLDHRDGNKSNNRIGNLRLASNGQNKANGAPYRNSKCGLKGACFYPRNGKWLAQIKFNGKRRHIGYFNCPTAAHLAYCCEAQKLHREFARFS